MDAAGSEREGGILYPCRIHPDREAVARCVQCGSLVCGECARRKGDLFYCPRCLPSAGLPAPPGGGGREGPFHACRIHPDREAVARCVQCGSLVCGECARRKGDLFYCPRCLPSAGLPAPPGGGGREGKERRWWAADWKLGEVLIALVLIFGIYSVVSLVLLQATENPFLYNSLSYALVFCPLIALSTWVILRRHRRGLRELGIRWEDPGRTLAMGGMGGVVSLAVSYGFLFLILAVLYLILGRMPETVTSQSSTSLGGMELILAAAVVVVLAPVFEEIFFRGLLYPALRSRMGAVPAVILDGFIFGVLHFQALFMLSLVAVGVILAYLYEKSGSLLTPMLTHALYNGVVVAIALLMGWPLF